jgi:hypothetical protein
MPKVFCKKCEAQKVRAFNEDGYGRKERHPLMCPVCEEMSCVCDETLVYISGKNPRLACPDCKIEVPVHFRREKVKP